MGNMGRSSEETRPGLQNDNIAKRNPTCTEFLDMYKQKHQSISIYTLKETEEKIQDSTSGSEPGPGKKTISLHNQGLNPN